MEKKKFKFWCNAGETEEIVEVEIYENGDLSEDRQIELAFHKWLDNNEDCGYEEI